MFALLQFKNDIASSVNFKFTAPRLSEDDIPGSIHPYSITNMVFLKSAIIRLCKRKF